MAGSRDKLDTKHQRIDKQLIQGITLIKTGKSRKSRTLSVSMLRLFYQSFHMQRGRRVFSTHAPLSIFTAEAHKVG